MENLNPSSSDADPATQSDPLNDNKDQIEVETGKTEAVAAKIDENGKETDFIILNDKIKIAIVQGDLTKETTDAIVNPANKYLMHGAGVAGAICKFGGESIQDESNLIRKKRGKVEPGNAVHTSAGDLPCKFVIHAVGPMWEHGYSGENETLQEVIINTLKLADELKIESVSIPAISSGIFGFPKELCAETFLKTIKLYFGEHKDTTTLKLVRLINIDSPTASVFSDTMKLFISGKYDENNKKVNDGKVSDQATMMVEENPKKELNDIIKPSM
jgi:O-acetyl-ADP-ribose deacetylase (regulator of RNase III)